MSSKARRTVLLPEPERPVRMTSWWASRLGKGFTEGGGSTLDAALMSARNAHVFAVFGDGAASDVDARIVKLLGELLIRERLGGVLFFNHFLDETLQSEQGHAAAFGAVHGFAKEGAELEHTLGSVGIFAGDGAADGGGVNTDFLSDFLDHHGLESIGAVIEKFALASNDGLADAKDGVLALLDVFHQLDGGGEAFLDVIADVAVGSVAGEEAPVSGAETELGHVIFVQEDLPLVVDFAEINVGLDKTRFSLVVTKAGTRIELLDDLERSLNDLQRAVERAGDFFQLVGLHLLQMFGNYLLGESILGIEGFQLEEQAFAKIASADADGIEILNDSESIIEIVLRILAVLCEFLGRGSEIAVFIQIADDAFGEFLDAFRADGDAQLPGEMIREATRRGEKFFERGPFGNFSFLGLAAVAAGVQIFIEKTADIELVERIGFRLFRDFFGFRFKEGFVAVVVGLSGFFAELFEDWIGDHLLVDHLAEFEAVERENADHLDKAGRQNLLLRHSKIEFKSLPSHDQFRLSPQSALKEILIQAKMIAEINAAYFRIVA